jgi:glycosyltransferase involved in cell wall biosynthesis
MLPEDFALLQVTPALDGGGVETLTVDMATAVAAAGRRSLVASHGGKFEEALKWGGAELIRLPVHSRSPLTVAANVGRLADVIRREKVSLVHVRSRAPAFSVLWATRATRTPMVATYHGVYSAGSPLKRWYNAVMTQGDVVIANSEFTRRHIREQHHTRPDRIVVIPEGVDVRIFDPASIRPERVAKVRAAWGAAPEESRPVVLIAARMAKWKGHGVAIAALARSRFRDTAQLVFTGEGQDGSYARSLKSEATRAGVAVTLAGPCNDMPAAYLAADVVAAPSTEPESFGRTVAEAAAMARVVVASNLGATPETIVNGPGGFLVPPGDVDAWTAAFDRALSLTKPERAQMGVVAWKRIRESYTLDAMCEATFDLYRRLCEGKREGRS